MTTDSLAVTIARVLADRTVAENADTIVRSPASTIVPSARRTGGAVERMVAEIVAASHGGIEAKLRIEGLLGEGGMGVVRLAEQRTLGRKVAIKSLKFGVNDPVAIEKLLNEAIVTGHVQHPSVVPIHDIVVDTQGRPAIVLKRIEGQPWEQLMFDERTVKRRFGADDLLEWNLQILMQVAQAVAYAHARGIVHRDLKPENVMVGEFGEVYVVDWGLAVAIGEDADARLPRLLEVEPMAGTPAYMAPEMLGGKGVQITRATDVYLLGAVLYEIISGEPPHRGESLQEIVSCIAISQPPPPAAAPAELVRIALRAMDADPHARFENATQLRLALQGYLKHQGSRRLASEADRRRAAVYAMLAANDAGERIDEATLQALSAECRFGYRQALEAWPENAEAAGSLRAFVEHIVAFELNRGQPRVAAAMLAGLEDTLPELAHHVETAKREKDREIAKLEALGRELDPETGRRTRTMLAVVFGSMWTVAPHLKRLPYFASMDEGKALILSPVFFLGIGTVLFLWARDTMTKTAINRFIAAYVGMVFFTHILLAWAALVTGMQPDVTYRLLFLLWGLAAGTIALIAQLRMLIAGVGYLMGFFILIRHPELRLWVSSFCHLLTTILAIVIWAPPIGPAKVLDTIDPKRNESMATYRISRPGKP